MDFSAIANALVNIYCVEYDQGTLFSCFPPKIITQNTGYAQVTYHNDGEKSIWVNEDDMETLTLQKKVSDLKEGLTCAYRVYAEEPLVLVKHVQGDIQIPKSWDEKDVSRVMGREVILTTETEMRHD